MASPWQTACKPDFEKGIQDYKVMIQLLSGFKVLYTELQSLDALVQAAYAKLYGDGKTNDQTKIRWDSQMEGISHYMSRLDRVDWRSLDIVCGEHYNQQCVGAGDDGSFKDLLGQSPQCSYGQLKIFGSCRGANLPLGLGDNFGSANWMTLWNTPGGEACQGEIRDWLDEEDVKRPEHMDVPSILCEPGCPPGTADRKVRARPTVCVPDICKQALTDPAWVG